MQIFLDKIKKPRNRKPRNGKPRNGKPRKTMDYCIYLCSFYNAKSLLQRAVQINKPCRGKAFFQNSNPYLWLDHKCMMAQVPKFRFSSLIIFHNLFLHMYRCRWSVYTWKHFFFKSYHKHVKMTERKENGRHTFCHRKDFSIQSCTLFWGILRVF